MAESARSEKILPCTGVLAGALFGIAVFVPKVSEEYGDPEGMQLMNDYATRNTIGAFAGALFCVAMLWFVSALRQALRPVDGEESILPNALFAGGIAVAGSKAVSALVLLAAVDAADQNDETAYQTLLYLGVNSWLPWVAASAVFFLATGLAALRSARLPRWFAIVSVILGVLCVLGPAGILVFMVTPLWLVMAGGLLARRHEAPVVPSVVR